MSHLDPQCDPNVFQPFPVYDVLTNNVVLKCQNLTKKSGPGVSLLKESVSPHTLLKEGVKAEALTLSFWNILGLDLF